MSKQKNVELTFAKFFVAFLKTLQEKDMPNGKYRLLPNLLHVTWYHYFNEVVYLAVQKYQQLIDVIAGLPENVVLGTEDDWSCASFHWALKHCVEVPLQDFDDDWVILAPSCHQRALEVSRAHKDIFEDIFTHITGMVEKEGFINPKRFARRQHDGSWMSAGKKDSFVAVV